MTLRTGKSKCAAGAFTLIELIIVMAMLVTVIAVTFPTLQRFFRGRTLESEARRFMTLTRFAVSRAVGEGIPMVLWIDATERSYGLQAQAGFLEKDEKAVSYELDERVEMEIDARGANRATLRLEQQRRRPIRIGATSEITFLPDGSIDVMSVGAVRFVDSDDGELWVRRAKNGLEFEVAGGRDED